MKLQHISKICVLFFFYVIAIYFYMGTIGVPQEGDSLNYHIPIAKAYLDGNIFHPDRIRGAQFLKYSPGASEGILSLFYLFNIPPNLYNVLGVLILFFSLRLLGVRFGLDKNTSLVFASSVATLTGIVRWLDSQIIDIYLLIFFVISIYLLEKPQKKFSYFIYLGIISGFLIGTKFSGLLFAAVLFVLYFRRIIRFINISNFAAFLIPLFVFGLSWYFRNYLVTGNPFYPQSFLFFREGGITILHTQVWKVFFTSFFGFSGTINAAISEYMILVLSVPIILFFVIKSFIQKKIQKIPRELKYLTIIGVLNLFIYLFLPSDYKDHIMVSVMRYSYPASIPFILGLFILAKKHRREEELALVVLIDMFFVGFPVTFYPKLIFIFIPFALFYFYHDRIYKS